MVKGLGEQVMEAGLPLAAPAYHQPPHRFSGHGTLLFKGEICGKSLLFSMSSMSVL
jgi:hypothetical protein